MGPVQLFSMSRMTQKASMDLGSTTPQQTYLRCCVPLAFWVRSVS